MSVAGCGVPYPAPPHSGEAVPETQGPRGKESGEASAPWPPAVGTLARHPRRASGWATPATPQGKGSRAVINILVEWIGD